MQILQADRCGPDIDAEVFKFAQQVEEVVWRQGEFRRLQRRRRERQVGAGERLR